MTVRLKIAHIVNPVKVDKSSDLYIAQPISFETMRVAKEFAEGQVEVALFSAQFPEDSDFVPVFFKKTPHLERSVLDLVPFKIKRKLPLLKDVLDRLFNASDADYLIYTNVDIALLPHFYLTVDRIIKSSIDSFVINRRTINLQNTGIGDIPLMYAEMGESHIGHDCFIFKRDIYPQFELGNVCVGIRLVGRVLLWNLVCIGQAFKEFKDLHMTFHIGQEKAWKNPDFAAYDRHNHQETLRVLFSLDETYNFLEHLRKNYPDYLEGIDLTKK